MSSNTDFPTNEDAHHHHHNHAAFYQQDNNAFAGYDPALGGEHHDALSYSNNQDWNFQPEQLGLSHGHDAQTSLYQGWHNPALQQHNHSLNLQPSQVPYDAYYDGTFAQGDQPAEAAGFDGSHDYAYQMQGNFDVPSSYNAPNNNSYQSQSAHYADAPAQLNTISPGALQSRPSSYINAPSPIPQVQQPKQETYRPEAEAPTRPSPQPRLPKGAFDGKFTIITPETLSGTVAARRFHNFLHVGGQLTEVPITKTTIPAYIPRKSRNEIKKLLANDSGLTAKLAKKPRKGSIIAPRAAPRRSETPTVTSKPVKTKSVTSPSSEELISSDDESDDESEEESMHPPLPATRPVRALEAVKYDSIKTLWRVPYRSVESDDIRKGLSQFWDIVRTIRDRWKSDTAAVKEAEDAKKVNEVELLKERVMNQRDMLEAALMAAVTEGHRDIIEHLGENLQLVVALAQFLQDRVRETEYSGTLARAILKLLARCTTLTDGTLEKTGVNKFLPRFQKRGDEEIRALAKRITDNATAAAKKRKEGAKPGVVAAKDTKALATSTNAVASPVAGTKRARPGDSGNNQPLKKVASEQGPAKGSVPPKRPTTDGTSSAPPVAVKKPIVPAKTTNFFQSLQSAKRPSGAAANATIVQAKPAARAEEKPVLAAASKPAASRAPAFSFADVMAGLNKPKEAEPEPTKPEEDMGPPENEQQKKTRLRKEQRRKLRVSWKPDSALEEIREFVHDPDEEYGFDPNQVRDARDKLSEGRMFKMKSHQDMMDIDDEDEPELPPSELDDMDRPFPQPTYVDFTNVIKKEEQAKLFAPYGGSTHVAASPERDAQEQREANTLIVVYADRSDIPPTPKEPPESTEADREPKPFGRPAQDILDLISPPAPVLPAFPTDIAAILGMLPQMQQQQPGNVPGFPMPMMQPMMQPMTPMQQPAGSTGPTKDIMDIFAPFSQRAQPPPAPVQVPQAQPQAPLPDVSAFLASLVQPQNTQAQQPQPTTAPVDISAILSALNPSGAAAPPNAAPMPAEPFPHMSAIPPMPLGANGMPDFAQMNQMAQMAAQFGMPPFPGFPGMPAFPSFPGQMPPQQDPATAATLGGFENPERQRLIAGGGQNNDDDAGDAGYNGGYDGWNGGKGGRTGGKGGRGGWREGNGEPPKFVVACKYWKEGKCRKGDKCTFLHTGVEGGG